MSRSGSKVKLKSPDGQQETGALLTVGVSETTNIGQYHDGLPCDNLITPKALANDSDVNKNDENAARPTPSPPKTAFMCFSATKV